MPGRASSPVSTPARRGPKAGAAVDSHKRGQDLRQRLLKSYVQGNVIDVSKASRFYQCEAAVAEALADYVERLPGSQYRIKNGFDTYFHMSLPRFLSGLPLQPADAIAHSFFRIAETWANGMYVDSLPGDWRCTRSEALNSEWMESWKHMEEKDWDAFRRMSSPLAQYITTALDETGKVDHELCYLPTAQHVELGVSFVQDHQQAPEMRILIKGGPAARFMSAYVRKSEGKAGSRDNRDELRNLRVIFESTMNTIAKEFLGITRPSKGRPRDVGRQAAYLLFHEQKSMHLVTRELCSLRRETNHLCDSKCSDKMKKAAANHFKHLRREILSLVKSSKKQF